MKMVRQFIVRLKREPAFAAIFIITLALGVGANAALFSALRGYFLAPLPYPDAGRLIVVNQAIRNNQAISTSTYDYLRRNAHSISAGGLSQEASGILTIGNSQARKMQLDAVTVSLFKTLNVTPLLGQTFGSDADKPHGPREVVLSYGFWQNTMHGDPHVVGKTLKINASPYTVVGVMPRGFYFPSRNVKFWVPFAIDPSELGPGKIGDLQNHRFIARLKPDVSLHAATRELNVLAQRQLQEASARTQNLAHRHNYHIVITTLRDSLIGPTGERLFLIELGAALLLLLTAAILANLVIVRTLAHRQEAALRLALGASRFALWRAALADTLPLGFIGGILAVGLAWWGTALITRYGIGTASTAFSVRPDIWMVAFSLVLGCLVGVVATLPASFASRKRLLTKLSEGGRGGTGQRARLAQRGLSVAQIALSVALMINAALLGFAFKQASSHPIGLNTQHLIIADLGLHGPRFRDRASQLAFYRTLGDAARKLPGIERAGVASALPFVDVDIYPLRRPGASKNDLVLTVLEHVDGHALDAVGTRLVHGRLIDANDVQAKGHVAVIDTDLARALFGTTKVVGRELNIKKQPYRVIGIIAPVFWSPRAQGRYAGTLWLPYSIVSQANDFYAGPNMDLAVRSTLPVQTVKRELDALLHKLAPNQAFGFIKSMHDLKQDAYHDDQALPILFGLFSLLALVLAGVGTYGTVAYLIRLRLGEFAVRQALGATPTRIGLLALAQGATLAVLGIGIGTIAGFLLARTLSGMIGGAGSATALAYIAAALVMALAALFATAIPAQRARRADLLSLLRPQ